MKPQLIKKQVHIGEQVISYVIGNEAANKVPIVFLHGWGISTTPYCEILELLAQDHFVIAPDLPGFAQSSSPKSTDHYKSYAEALIAFLETLQIEKVHLAGHSLGGGISVTIAALAPDKVESLVLIDSTGVPSGSVPEVLVRRAIEMPLQINPSKLKLQFIDIPQVFSYNLLFRLENVVSALLLSLEQDLRPILENIQTPCLILWSEKDLTTPLSAAQELAQKIANSKLVIVKEGFHEWVLWYPEETASIVLDFVQTIERSNQLSLANN